MILHALDAAVDDGVVNEVLDRKSLVDYARTNGECDGLLLDLGHMEYTAPQKLVYVQQS